MNTFVGIGKIVDVNQNGKVLKFSLAVQQEKPCYVPCVLFDPDDKVKKFMDDLQTKEQTVWLQGRISSHEFEYQGKTIRKIEVVSYPNGIRII